MRILDFSGVERFVDTPVKHYSSGMYMRLAFAIAAHLETDILLVDEVLAVGDAEFQKKCLGKMSEMTKNCGRTVLFVSHQLGMVTRLCSRAILLSGGSIAFSGPTDAVVDRYVNITSSPERDRDVRLPSPREPAAITGIEIVTSNGTPTVQVSWDAPFTIRVRLQLKRPIGGMLLGVALDSQRGGRVTTWVAQLAKYIDDGVEEPELCLEVSPGILAPGNYSLAVGLTEAALTILHLREGEWPFAIVDTGSPMAAYSHVDYGVAIIPATWSAVGHSNVADVAIPSS